VAKAGRWVGSRRDLIDRLPGLLRNEVSASASQAGRNSRGWKV
jgi:hypothetical protein